MGSFMDAVKARRSYYALQKSSPLSDEALQQLVEEAVLHCPSAFNSQSARVVVLLGARHDQLWTIVHNILQANVAPEKFPATEEKIAGFASAYGTLLFFEDQQVVHGLQEKFPLYATNFPLWSLQSSGMLQFTLWTALEEAGLGISLQHYNPLIDEEVRQAFDIPENWMLLSQMPFGTPLAEPGPKEFSPLAPRIKIFK